jgi:hypothetical protein
MLMLLLALIDLGRTRVHRATRWLWMALSGGLWLGGAACEDTQPQVLYGPAPDYVTDPDVPQADVPVADLRGTDLPSVDVPAVPDVPADCQMMAYYGPQPCDTNAECEAREGPGWYCDTANTFADGCGGSILWPLCRPGDVPVDAVTPDVPVDAPRDCEPVVGYGPPPCTADDTCRAWGEDWYCDKDHPVTDPCTGGSWYVCAMRSPDADVPPADASLDALPADLPVDAAKDCPPMGWYGPPPCTSDAECVQSYGADWVCRQDNPVPDGCGGTTNYPVCEPKAR